MTLGMAFLRFTLVYWSWCLPHRLGIMGLGAECIQLHWHDRTYAHRWTGGKLTLITLSLAVITPLLI